MERRELFKILGAGLLTSDLLSAQHRHAAAAEAKAALVFPPPGYTPRALSDAQYKLLDQLTELIIPTDDTPGARDAGVSWFIDTTLFYEKEEGRAPWLHGLDFIEAESKERFQKGFLDLDNGQQTQLLERLAENERNPTTKLEKFFVRLKRQTVYAYYFSEIGQRQALGYKGDAILKDFPGCTHPEHQRV